MLENIKLDKNDLRELLFCTLIEKRTSRRWRIFFTFLFLASLLFLLIIIFYNNKKVEHVAVISITGLISDKSYTNSTAIVASLNEAFNNKYSKAIILKINSPGGTPVQANIIHNHIKKLRNIHKNKPVYAVIEDIGTSAAYLIAIAADKIYCDPYSIVGSIGVIINSFGFSDAIARIGVERRIYKAGKNKVVMDPFLERNLDDEKILQHNLDIMHNNFIDNVKANRYKNIHSFDESDIFSGKFWIGKDALSLGLVDGFYDIYSLSSDIIKVPFLIDYKIETLLDIFKSSIRN